MKGTIKDEVAIVGMGCIKFGELWDKSWEDMVVEAAVEAYDDAGMSPAEACEQIEAAWIGTIFAGVSGTLLADTLKLDGKPITRIENHCATPMDAFRNACFAVAAGIYDVVLALGVEKLKDTGFSGVPSMELFSNFGIYCGRAFSAPGSFGLPFVRYSQKYGVTREHLAKIAVKNHHNGSLNPKAHFQKEVTVEQVLNAPIVSWPHGLFDCCGNSDGAAAAVICRADIAKEFRDDYLLVKGMGLAIDSMPHWYRPGFDYLGWPATQRAAKQAYEMAGIADPYKEIDLLEVHDCFTTTEMLTYGDLGLIKREETKDYIEQGVFELQGEKPINPSGGLKSFGHPVGASGLRMLYEVYKQLQCNVDNPARQVKGNPTMGLAHQIGGAPQVSGVTIIGLP